MPRNKYNEPEAGETKGHEERAEHSNDGSEGDPELGVDQVDLVEGVVDVEEEEGEQDSVGDVLGPVEHLWEVDVDGVGQVVPILAVQGVKLVQMLLEAGNELGLFLPQDHRHGVGDGPLPVVDGVPLTKPVRMYCSVL